MKICTVCGIDNLSKYTKFCQKCMHKDWLKRNKDRICKTCNKIYNSMGINCTCCARKLREEKRKGRMCKGCSRNNILIINQSLLLCQTCERKRKDNGDINKKIERRNYERRRHRIYMGRDPDAPLMYAPRGSGSINNFGYRVITKKGHPNCKNAHGQILEHTYIMSQHIGRPLKKGESVHHKNGIRNDNRIDNLELWHKGQPAGQRVEDKVKWAIEFLKEYGYDTLKSTVVDTFFH